MVSYRKIRYSLAVWIAVCTGLTSCKPSSMRTNPTISEKPASEQKAGPERNVLSKEQIISIANAVARRYGRDPDKSIVIYDEENALWRSTFPAGPAFDGHDYQAVAYRDRSGEYIFSGHLWVIIDRNTGEVLRVLMLQ